MKYINSHLHNNFKGIVPDFQNWIPQIVGHTRSVQNCKINLEYGKLPHMNSIHGFKTATSNMSVTEIFEIMQTTGPSECLRTTFPKVTDNEWSAIMQLVLAMLIAVEDNVEE